MSSKPNIATVTMLRDSLQNTFSFVQYHLNSGIDHMYLFFDNPEDEAIAYLENNSRLSCFRCNEKYWLQQGLKPNAKIETKQKTNATFALRLARKANLDWLIHLDSDELLYSKHAFKHLFSNISKETEVVRFPVLEALPQKMEYDNPFWEITYFKVDPQIYLGHENFTITAHDKQKQLQRVRFWHYRKRLYQLLCKNYNHYLTGSFMMGHTVGKAATRTTAKIQQIDIHVPIPPSGYKLNMTIAQQAYILHYDCQGYKKWKQKWEKRIGGLANHKTKHFGKKRKKQMQIFQEAFQTGEEKCRALYKELYYYSRYEKAALYLTGMIKKVNLDKKLFEPRAG